MTDDMHLTSSALHAWSYHNSSYFIAAEMYEGANGHQEKSEKSFYIHTRVISKYLPAAVILYIHTYIPVYSYKFINFTA